MSERYFRANPEATACPLGDGLAIFDQRSNAYFSLNQSGALIWQAASEPRSLTELSQAVAHAFARAQDEVAEDVARVVLALVDAGLFLASPDASMLADDAMSGTSAQPAENPSRPA